MSNFKTYCRIIDYLDATDPDLAQLVRGTCVDMTIGSTKGKPGVTLLIPDKDYRGKIAKLAYSSDPAEATQACDMLNALILRDIFKTGDDFRNKRANIPNSLYPSQHVGVKDVKGNVVTFESGAVATLDAKFLDSSKKKNLAVWHLKGEIPVTNDKPAKIERGPAGRGPKTAGKHGGYALDSATLEMSKQLRWKIAVAVENEYALRLMMRQTGGLAGPDPFIRCAMSLVDFLSEKSLETLQKVRPLLSISRADFYFLVEPHKDGDFLVSNALIEEWWGKRASHANNRGCQILDELNAAAGDKDLPRISKVREEVLAKCNNRQCVDTIASAYATHYPENGSLKMLQDELRFLIHCSFEELEASYDHGKLSEIVNMIGEYMHKMNGTEAERKAGNAMLNASKLKYAIAPSDQVETIKCFVNSNYFMFVPLSAAEERANRGKSHTEKPKPGQKGLWNIVGDNIAKYATHNRIANGENIDELEAALKDVDPETAARIRAAVGKK
jgi:hypothetical protein